MGPTADPAAFPSTRHQRSQLPANLRYRPSLWRPVSVLVRVTGHTARIRPGYDQRDTSRQNRVVWEDPIKLGCKGFDGGGACVVGGGEMDCS
ncbi:hypothetical protein L1987_64505 [Smallanthus sonchifolius]|uniref:Uncharacterized protein n=1 Tax=Smallanthus sonchifolius TaxID=185202 RepID=A0ACB9CGA2_9ASTR|nr:hypothetical protein L1987_64505 [Smallanthus sonchifolius]